MILTEEKTYSMSLMLEDCSSTPGLNKKSYELEFTNRELIHAAFTCGMPIQRLTPAYPGKRQTEFLMKIAMIETALEAEGDRLKKSHELDYLDSGEKSMISYYVGMVLTKLISGKLFHLDYLTHINLIPDPEKEGYIDVCGMRRSDLIGYQRKSKAYSVWGAKGRSENSPRALENGCILAQSVKSICGQNPQSAAVCMTYYENSYLTAYIKQPKMKGECELNFQQKEYYKAYYRPMMEFFRESSAQTVLTEENCREVTMYLPYFTNQKPEDLRRRVTIGIPCKIYEAIRQEDYERLQGEVTFADETERHICAGQDYIYIK